MTSLLAPITSKMRPLFVMSAGETRSRCLRSITVRSSPRTLTTPTTSLGARGTSVTGGSFRISRTSPIETAYVSVPSLNARYSTRGPRTLIPRRAGPPPSRGTRSAIAPHPDRQLALHERLFDERRRVEHQRHPLVAELGRAREPLHLRERRAERLDDDVLLSDDLVDHQPEPPNAHADDDRVGAQPRTVDAREAEQLVDAAERK